MSELLHFVLLGLAVGALYALTAQGLVLIYRGLGSREPRAGRVRDARRVHLLRVDRHREAGPRPSAWLLAIGIPAALGALTHLLVMRRLRHASALVRLVSTLGIFFFLTAVAYQIWGFDVRARPLAAARHHLRAVRRGQRDHRRPPAGSSRS